MVTLLTHCIKKKHIVEVNNFHFCLGLVSITKTTILIHQANTLVWCIYYIYITRKKIYCKYLLRIWESRKLHSKLSFLKRQPTQMVESNYQNTKIKKYVKQSQRSVKFDMYLNKNIHKLKCQKPLKVFSSCDWLHAMRALCSSKWMATSASITILRSNLAVTHHNLLPHSIPKTNHNLLPHSILYHPKPLLYIHMDQFESVWSTITYFQS